MLFISIVDVKMCLTEDSSQLPSTQKHEKYILSILTDSIQENTPLNENKSLSMFRAIKTKRKSVL